MPYVIKKSHFEKKIKFLEKMTNFLENFLHIFSVWKLPGMFRHNTFTYTCTFLLSCWGCSCIQTQDIYMHISTIMLGISRHIIIYKKHFKPYVIKNLILRKNQILEKMTNFLENFLHIILSLEEYSCLQKVCKKYYLSVNYH